MDATGDMRAFVQVVEDQGFSVLGLTPSAVSKLVTRLEERLGVRLLRTTRRLALTSEGDIYFACARRILADIAEAEIEVTKRRGAPRGHLHVNTSSGFGVHELAPALPDFLMRYPEITLKLSITDRVVDLVADHADMTIRAGQLADTSLSARKIAEFERTICAAPSYLVRCGVPRSPADLAKHTCIGLTFQVPTGWEFRAHDGVVELEVSPRVTTDDGETALGLALAGAGIVRLCDIVLAEPIRRGLLVPLLTDFHRSRSVPLSALYLAGRHRLPKVRVFLDFLIERFGSAPWRVKAGKPKAPEAVVALPEMDAKAS